MSTAYVSLTFAVVLGGLASISTQGQGLRAVTRRTVMAPFGATLPSAMVNQSRPQGNTLGPTQPRTNPAPRPVLRYFKKKAGSDAKRLAWQTKRAEAGSPHSQYDLALRFLIGDGVKRDRRVAMKWLESAAGQGYGPAKTKLAHIRSPKPLLQSSPALETKETSTD
jgi:hypothetical protein